MGEKQYFRCPECNHLLGSGTVASITPCPHCAKAARTGVKVISGGGRKKPREQHDRAHLLAFSKYHISHYLHTSAIVLLVPIIALLSMPVVFSLQTTPTFAKVRYLSEYQEELTSSLNSRTGRPRSAPGGGVNRLLSPGTSVELRPTNAAPEGLTTMMRDDRTKRELDQLMSVLANGKMLTRLMGAVSGLLAGGLLGLLYLRDVGRLGSRFRSSLASVMILVALIGTNIYAVRYARAEAISVYNASTDTVERLVGSALHESIIGHNSVLARRFINEAGALEYRDRRGANPLHLAVEAGMADLVSVLLANRDVEVEALDRSGASPLLYASRGDNAQIAQLLLDAGARVGTRETTMGRGVLHAPAARKDTSMLKLFLEHDADPKLTDLGGTGPLAVAAQNDNRRAVALLVEHGANPNEDIGDGLTLLQKTLHSLLERIERSRSRLDLDELPDVALLESLLEHDADINATHQQGRTPLHCASAAIETLSATSENAWAVGHVIQLLMAHGAQVARMDDSGTPAYQLGHAARIGRLDDVRQIYEADPSKLNQPNSKNKAPLQVAIEEGQHETVTYLLDQGADLSAWGVSGETALDACIDRQDAKMVSLLLEHGIQDVPQNLSQGGALHSAARLGDSEIARLLLENGYDATSQTSRGDTALHVAARGGSIECVKVLLASGADATTWNANGETPLAIAKAEDHAEVHSYLKDWIWKNQQNVN